MTELKEMLNCLDQVGIVVKDIEKTKAAMKQLFDLEPSKEQVAYHKNVLYRGKPSKPGARILVYNFCNIEIEIMSPIGNEKSAWKEFADVHGEGLHHIRFNIADHEAVKQALAKKGIEAFYCGDSMLGGGVKFAYYDAGPDLGVIIETLNIREFAKGENDIISEKSKLAGENIGILKEELKHLDQIAVVVKDIDKAKTVMKYIFDLDPADDVVKSHKNTLYRGEPSNCKVRILVYDFCNIEIEIMSPVNDEKNLWQDFIDEHGFGLHHIRFSIQDHEGVKKALLEKGATIHQSGDSTHGKGIKFAYYDLGPALGFVLETLNCSSDVSKKNPEL